MKPITSAISSITLDVKGADPIFAIDALHRAFENGDALERQNTKGGMLRVRIRGRPV